MKASSASGLCASVSVVMDEWVASLRFLCVLRVSAVRYAFFIAEDAESAGLLGGERGHQVVPVAGGDLPAALLVFLVRLPVGKEPPLDRLLVGAVAEGGEVAPDQHDLEVPLRRALVEHRPVKRDGDDAAFALELFQDGQVLRPVAGQPLVGLARRQLVVARDHRPGRPSLPLGINRRLRRRGLTDEKRKEKIEKSKREFRVSPEASGFEFRFSHCTVSSSAWGMGEAWWWTSRQSPLRST